MTDAVPVVDLFSGPGGLAEGFAALKDPLGRPRFNVVLSIEMEPTARRTLLLRGFLRKFPSGYPPAYYDFLNGVLAKEPDWASLYPREWQEACDETWCLKLGTSEASSFVRQRIAGIRAMHGDRTVLLGGPPCQSYSVVGGLATSATLTTTPPTTSGNRSTWSTRKCSSSSNRPSRSLRT